MTTKGIERRLEVLERGYSLDENDLGYLTDEQLKALLAVAKAASSPTSEPPATAEQIELAMATIRAYPELLD